MDVTQNSDPLQARVTPPPAPVIAASAPAKQPARFTAQGMKPFIPALMDDADTVSTVSPPALFHVFLDMPITSLFLLVIALVGLTVIHELLHAVVHPMKGLSPRTVLGFWPSTLMFYAHYDGEVSRNRLIAILLTPLIIISIVPLVVAAVVQVTSGWAAFLSCFNAVLACVDMLGVAMLLFQVPRTAVVRNQGWKSYWKEADPATA